MGGTLQKIKNQFNGKPGDLDIVSLERKAYQAGKRAAEREYGQRAGESEGTSPGTSLDDEDYSKHHDPSVAGAGQGAGQGAGAATGAGVGAGAGAAGAGALGASYLGQPSSKGREVRPGEAGNYGKVEGDVNHNPQYSNDAQQKHGQGQFYDPSGAQRGAADAGAAAGAGAAASHYGGANPQHGERELNRHSENKLTYNANGVELALHEKSGGSTGQGPQAALGKQAGADVPKVSSQTGHVGSSSDAPSGHPPSQQQGYPDRGTGASTGSTGSGGILAGVALALGFGGASSETGKQGDEYGHVKTQDLEQVHRGAAGAAGQAPTHAQTDGTNISPAAATHAASAQPGAGGASHGASTYTQGAPAATGTHQESQRAYPGQESQYGHQQGQPQQGYQGQPGQASQGNAYAGQREVNQGSGSGNNPAEAVGSTSAGATDEANVRSSGIQSQAKHDTHGAREKVDSSAKDLSKGEKGKEDAQNKTSNEAAKWEKDVGAYNKEHGFANPEKSLLEVAEEADPSIKDLKHALALDDAGELDEKEESGGSGGGKDDIQQVPQEVLHLGLEFINTGGKLGLLPGGVHVNKPAEGSAGGPQ